MDIIQVVILALIQGLTEFLPISSSAHLILPSQLLGWPDQGLAFDVAVHIGSLMAVMFYFRADIYTLVAAWCTSCRDRQLLTMNDDAFQAWMILLATLPAVLIGWLAKDYIALELRSNEVIAMSTLLFALLMAWAELSSRQRNDFVKLSWQIALCIGLAQAVALIPGTSRSGVTITAALLLGLAKTDAARFSFLLSIPIIFAAGMISAIDLSQQATLFSWGKLSLALVVAAISAYLCIGIFMRLIERIGLMPFVWYRLGLGLILLLVI